LRRDQSKPLRFSQSSRKHKIGRKHIKYVINTYEFVYVFDEQKEQQLLWIGMDERGRELEVVAFLQSNCYFVVHAMPLMFRRKNG
jgi:hypothetical protein